MSDQKTERNQQQTDQGGPPAKGSDPSQTNLDPSMSPKTSAPESTPNPAERKAGKGQQEAAEE